MIDAGILEYMRDFPERFHRRVRRGIPQHYRWQVWKSRLGISSADPLLQETRVGGGRSGGQLRLRRTTGAAHLLLSFGRHRPDVGFARRCDTPRWPMFEQWQTGVSDRVV